MTMVNSLAGALREAGLNYDNRKDDPNFYKYLVKAVLERMREPTAEMIYASDMSSQHDIPSTKEIWQAMIDVILNEK